MTPPKVSIVIPSYKKDHFEPCLKSAIGQSYLNTEILVSDNCPSESIHDICLKYPNVIYQRSSALRVDNILSSFYSGKGEYIKPLFDDDILHPFCVERMVAVMESDPSVEMVYSASEIINAGNNRQETRRPYKASGSLIGRELARQMALGMCNPIGEFTTIMMRRKKIWDIGASQFFKISRHDFSLGLADVAAYINLMKDGKAFYIDEELSYFRRDIDLMSNSNPVSNPNFGYCFSDYIDLITALYEQAMISKVELMASEKMVLNVTQQLGAIFPQVIASCLEFQTYLRHIAEHTEKHRD
jgi:glycosyltransferase involved in cell wall biosynthesis